ncbi:glutamine dependent NAD synthetase [Apiospora phragmitis]|uniref:Glutamine-dependent NAD(+) synthetase n=1 Tax=Apiospora phragmitis TaxID=2905665 RepID=A0ABR1U953_9PEZI
MGGHLVTVAACSLNQWALDWEGNLERIVESIRRAKAAGARLRVGPELEISGYMAQDHFKEQDTFLHSLEVLARILTDKSCYDIILDLGLPIQHRNVSYNCRVICYNSKILLIRPKQFLASDLNYREQRWFLPWSKPRQTEDYHLPRMLQKIQGATHVPFGDALISSPDTCFGAETCEELFTPNAPTISMGLDGAEVFTNSSASHWEIQKLDTRIKLICEATRKSGGVYLYANQKGGDGDRLYFDGCSMIIVNGDIVAQGSQFSLDDVEVVTATVDLEEVRAYRSGISRGYQAVTSLAKYQRIQTDFELSPEEEEFDITKRRSAVIQPRYHSVEEEIALAAGCYLWDYLRRSGQAGYLAPLSGGIDSCATATIVFSMCRIVMQAVKEGNPQVIEDVKRVAKYKGENVLPDTPQELCNQIFSTIYMGMATMSSAETRKRAKDLAEAIGSYHIDLNIDDVYNAQKALIVNTTGFDPQFKVHGGSYQENITLQCLQARIRMVTAYEFGQILSTTRGRPGGGSLLVLGSANVGESLRGYLTKYDCSSADINPIGSIDKSDLKRFIKWAVKDFDIPCLQEFLDATPTAELEPITSEYVQADEADMGFTYDELTVLGRLRKEVKLGPFGMFQRLVHDWSADYTPAQVAEKTKRFHHFYAINRHKMTTLTPSLHAQPYSPDDNRFDLRPFLYPPFWKSWSFKRIDAELERIEATMAKKKKDGGVEAEID